MLDPNVLNALNGHVNAEIYSAYLYYSMSVYFDARGLPGMAHWMRQQAGEELIHANKFVQYICNRGEGARMGSVQGPPLSWESPLAVFQAALEHERAVSARINELVDAALAARDHATNSMLQWFVNEQIEEEARVDQLVQQLRMAEGNMGALLMLDRELAQRLPAETALAEPA